MPKHILCAMNYKKLLFVIIVMIVIMQNGCKLFDYNDKNILNDINKKIMPSVVNKDVNKIGNLFKYKGYNVYVKRDSIIHQSLKYKPISLDGKLLAFNTHKWNHMISAQSPAAGSILKYGDTIMLTAGIHHGVGPMMPWIETHGVTVKFKGASRCFTCHDSLCLGCHVPK